MVKTLDLWTVDDKTLANFYAHSKNICLPIAHGNPYAIMHYVHNGHLVENDYLLLLLLVGCCLSSLAVNFFLSVRQRIDFSYSKIVRVEIVVSHLRALNSDVWKRQTGNFFL